MLVDPVGRQPAHQPLVPPRRLVDLLVPGPRRVPVVADVVVVEDHAARQGRQEPPDRLVAPGEAVEVGVLLVVLDLLAGRLRDVAPRGDELPHLLGGLVGIDLVADEGEDVGPLRLAVREREREGAQGVDAVAVIALPVVRHARATRAEEQPRRPRPVDRADARRREGVVLGRPHGDVADADGIRQLVTGRRARRRRRSRSGAP